MRKALRTLCLFLFTYDCVRIILLRAFVLGQTDINFGRPQLSSGLSPLSGLFDLWTFIKTGQIDPVLPASMALVVMGFILSLFIKRAFCSWVCPIGTMFDGVTWLSKKISSGIAIPPPVHKLLSGLKVLLGIIVLMFVCFIVPTSTILMSWNAPYWAVSDMAVIKLFILPGTLMISVALVILALFLITSRNIWCMYLCPLGGLHALISRVSVIAVKRNASACIQCSACDNACPAHIQVSQTSYSIRHSNCTGCMECIAQCPCEGAMEISLGKTRLSPAVVIGAGVMCWIVSWMIFVILGMWYGQTTPEWIIYALQYLQ